MNEFISTGDGGCIHAEAAWWCCCLLCLYESTTGDNNGEYLVALDSLL